MHVAVICTQLFRAVSVYIPLKENDTRVTPENHDRKLSEQSADGLFMIYNIVYKC